MAETDTKLTGKEVEILKSFDESYHPFASTEEMKQARRLLRLKYIIRMEGTRNVHRLSKAGTAALAAATVEE